MTKKLILIVCLLALMLSACGKKDDAAVPAVKTEPTIPEVTFNAIRVLPPAIDSLKIPLPDSTRTVLAKDAAAYLGQSYDHYRYFDFVGLVTGHYQMPGAWVWAEIAQFASADDAYGIYASLRPDGAPLNQLGTESYTSGNTTWFCIGEYMVTLSAEGELSDPLAAVKPLADQIIFQSGIRPAMPLHFMLFPMANKIVPSTKYTAYNYMDIGGLDSVYTTRYLLNGDTVTLFLTMDQSGAKYLKFLEYAETVGETVPKPKRFQFDDNYSFAVNHPDLGIIVAGLVRSKLVGIINYNPRKSESFATGWVKGLN